MANGFNYALFNENYDANTYPCACNCCFHLRHKNNVDIVIHENVPDTVKLDIGAYVKGNVGDNVYYVHDEAPTTSTVGEIGDVALNLYDMKSWKCTAITTSGVFLYTWEEDAEFTPREEGNTVFAMSSHYYEDKEYEFVVKNSRHEDIYTETLQAASPLKLTIEGDMLNVLKRGTYPYEITLTGPVVNSNDSSMVPLVRMADSLNSVILVV